MSVALFFIGDFVPDEFTLNRCNGRRLLEGLIPMAGFSLVMTSAFIVVVLDFLF